MIYRHLLLLTALFAFPLFAQTQADSLSVPTQCIYYQDGSYFGESKGFSGTVSVCVTVKKHKIDKVEVVKHSENRPLNAIEFVPRSIKKAKTVEEAEAVSRATITSNAIKTAVKNALAKALVKTE